MKNYQNILSKNASRLSDLVSDLLDIAKFDLTGQDESSGGSRRISDDSNNNSNDNHHGDDKDEVNDASGLLLNKERIDLVKEIDDLVNVRLAKQLKEKHIEIDFVYTDKTNKKNQCWVYVDRTRIRQVLSNLTDNAIKHSNEFDTIIIAIKEEENEEDKDKIAGSRLMAVISISDMGGGISLKMMPRLFEKFATDSASGTGLGLYISKKIVEAHGGRIWAENNKNGKGATFYFCLPIE